QRGRDPLRVQGPRPGRARRPGQGGGPPGAGGHGVLLAELRAAPAPASDLQLQRAGKQGEGGGKPARLLAVDVEEHLLVAARLERPAAKGARARPAHVPAVVDRGRLQREVLEVVPAPDGDVEAAVGWIGLRRDPHSAAKVLAIGDCDRGDAERFLGAVIDPKPHLLVAPAGDRAHAGDEEAPLPAEDLAARVDRAIDLSADAEAGDVDEVALARRSVRAGVANPPHVEWTHLTLQTGAAVTERAVQ